MAWDFFGPPQCSHRCNSHRSKAHWYCFFCRASFLYGDLMLINVFRTQLRVQIARLVHWAQGAMDFCHSPRPTFTHSESVSVGSSLCFLSQGLERKPRAEPF